MFLFFIYTLFRDKKSQSNKSSKNVFFAKVSNSFEIFKDDVFLLCVILCLNQLLVL